MCQQHSLSAALMACGPGDVGMHELLMSGYALGVARSAQSTLQPRHTDELHSHLERRRPSLLLERIHAQLVVQVTGEVREGV